MAQPRPPRRIVTSEARQRADELEDRRYMAHPNPYEGWQPRHVSETFDAVGTFVALVIACLFFLAIFAELSRATP